MTDHIEQLRGMMAKAAAGPWSVIPDNPHEVCAIHNAYNPDLSDPLVAESLWHYDAAFIVAMRNALPALQTERGTIRDGALSWPRLRAHWPGKVKPRTVPWEELEYHAEVLEIFRDINKEAKP